ncbi:MAG: hypothetical protein K9K67_10185 [Bacteriovoracaceae bacterium]|nr:hypothetical protein [Bacteriovoracaceae bacterium]
MSKLIAILLLSMNLQAAPKCDNHKFEYFKDKKKIIEKARTCIDIKEKQPMIYSESCLKGKCQAVVHLMSHKEKSLYKPMGSPHFEKCHKMGGFPIRVIFKNLISSRKTMICHFKEDNSFLNTEALFLWPSS